jgi:hypothetical protein
MRLLIVYIVQKNISYLKMSFFLKKKKEETTHYVILGRQYLLKKLIIYKCLHISSSIMICVSCDNYEWVSKKVNFQHN